MAKKSMAAKAAKVVTPVAMRAAPGLTATFVHRALERAIDGAGPMRGAAASAEQQLSRSDGDVDDAVRGILDSHVSLAGLQGFVTNLGGVITMAVAIPANISGLAMLQCHLVGGIAHLRGYDLDDPRVRNAVIACLVGEHGVKDLIKHKKLPSTPMGIATAPTYDPELDWRISKEVANELIARIAGKRTIAVLARRTPVVGGGVGAVTDGLATYEIGQYAARHLRSRRPRQRVP
jgi:hypothetical protein